MSFQKYFVVANTREEFKNESEYSSRPYSDHPSRESIDFVISELAEVGYNAEYFGGIEKLIEACNQKEEFPGTMFLNFSDGLSQISRKAQSAILLELLGVPYAGSDPLAQLIAGNKAYTKRIVSEKLEVPQGFTVFKRTQISPHISYPIILKPNREGSSIGITQKSICTNEAEVQQRLPAMLKQFNEVLLEEYIPGYEVTCFIIGNKYHYYLTEPIICEYNGIQYFEDFVFGLEEKASRKRKEFLAQNILTLQQVEIIRKSAQIAFEMLNLHDFARADFRLQKDGRLVFIEINGNPVISNSSELGIISRELDIPFGGLVEKIIMAATDRLAINRD